VGDSTGRPFNLSFAGGNVRWWEYGLGEDCTIKRTTNEGLSAHDRIIKSVISDSFIGVQEALRIGLNTDDYGAVPLREHEIWPRRNSTIPTRGTQLCFGLESRPPQVVASRIVPGPDCPKET
jgi:hypothetical protein